MAKKIIRVFIAVLLFGCAASTTQQGAMVRVTTKETVSKCKFLKQVNASSSIGGLMMQESGRRSAINQLKNAAAEVGGNCVVIVDDVGGFGGQAILGDVYKCEE